MGQHCTLCTNLSCIGPVGVIWATSMVAAVTQVFEPSSADSIECAGIPLSILTSLTWQIPDFEIKQVGPTSESHSILKCILGLTK